MQSEPKTQRHQSDELDLGEAERETERKRFMGKLQAVGKDPRAALEEMGG